MKLINRSFIIVSIIFLFLFSIPFVHANIALDHVVHITVVEDTYDVEEKITINQTNTTIRFTIHPEFNNDLDVIINDTTISPLLISDNTYEINYSQSTLPDKTVITLTYTFPKTDTSQLFIKEFNMDTHEFNLKFKDEPLFSSENNKKGVIQSIHFPTEKDTSTSLNIYITILIVLLVVLLIVTSAYGLKKRRNNNKRNREAESSELLTTEKALLMDVLKDIEKKHRDQKISDETYQKLKTHYKQQTIDIMSNLKE